MLYSKRKQEKEEKYDFPAGTELIVKKKTSGSLTLEAACVLPIFLFVMLSVLQFAKIERVSSSLLAGMQDTVKNMATYAYIRQIGAEGEETIDQKLLAGGISAAYARKNVENKSQFKESDGSLSFFRSSYLQKDMIDLAVTYTAKNTYTIFPIPKTKAILRARVRAWTGRDGNGSTSSEEGTIQQEEMVFVTETGSVYHKDENCTHIRLSIRNVSKEEIRSLRNKSGGKYHACERCRTKGNGAVYITDHGDRYHSSLGCSGLKRSVVSVPLSEVKNRRACSKCGG